MTLHRLLLLLTLPLLFCTGKGQSITLNFPNGSSHKYGTSQVKSISHTAPSTVELSLQNGSTATYDATQLDSISYAPWTASYPNYMNGLQKSLKTDKACYRPGECVTFTIDKLQTNAKVRYRHLNDLIEEHPLTTTTWTWQPPSDDNCGYLVDIYVISSSGRESLLGSIAVDVSSDWKMFPRYGFVATFGSDKTSEKVAEEMEFLSRCHINGVQFQDWHYKHHKPLAGTRTSPLSIYKDIANRDIYRSAIDNYISEQHRLGMKSIFYNLCYGALDDDGAEADGVKPQWYQFQDKAHKVKDYHPLKKIGWKSDIYLLDPSNSEWQQYIAKQNDDVYAVYDFDGYQIDQLGNRGTRYNYSGTELNLPSCYASFIKAMKKAHPDKSLVMNAVSNYGASRIAETGKVDFCYNEMWSGEANFTDLYKAIHSNQSSGGSKMKTVFAAYMNYEKEGSTFNEPGILLTDAVIFALGGAHLELGGDHMLCSEYFPNSRLSMSSSLKSNIIKYYDFHTAYENLLRDGGSEYRPPLAVANESVTIAYWGTAGPKTGQITAYAKRNVKGKQVVHLLNFIKANSVSWRDLDGTMPTPQTVENLTITIGGQGNKIKNVWYASPDVYNGIPQNLHFSQTGKEVTFTVPKLQYWDMIVIE